MTVNQAGLQWAVAATASVSITTALLLLFGGPRHSLPPPPFAGQPGAAAANPAAPAVQMVRPTSDNALLREEAELRDLRPLFLPTEFNVGPPEPPRSDSRKFLENDAPKLGITETEWSLARDLPAIALVNGKPAEEAKPLDALVAEDGGIALTGFGREKVSVPTFDARGGYVEVVAIASGHQVLAQPLPPEARPPGDKPWEPIEFLATVNAAGLAAPLVVTTSSRVEEVDAHYRNFLARRYRIGDRLPPGFYQITVGP